MVSALVAEDSAEVGGEKGVAGRRVGQRFRLAMKLSSGPAQGLQSQMFYLRSEARFKLRAALQAPDGTMNVFNTSVKQIQ